MNIKPDTFITIKQGEEYQSREENIYQKNSFFAASYRQAADCLKEIIAANRLFKGNPGSPCVDDQSDAAINQHLLGYPNNIVAFCAERGQGKTSAMVSFSKALRELHPSTAPMGSFQDAAAEDSCLEEKSDFWKTNDDFNIQECHFVVIDSIDPTTMECNDSIIKVILSRMFNQFQTEWEKRMGEPAYDCNHSGSKQSERIELLKMFQKCYHNLQVIDSKAGSPEDDLLEQMMELGNSSNMRGAMFRLIRKFLRFMCRNSCQSYLVVQIDDADFNIDLAYKIIDDIRRYLVLPQVIVLLSANMSQLETTVEQYFIGQYKTSIKNKGLATVARCHDIAERYISKVIPGYHRIYLPDLQKALMTEYEHLQVKYLDAKGHNILDEKARKPDENIMEAEVVYSYQDQLLRFLYQRTGIILLNPENFLHNLLPGNMRELTHFLAYFNQMEKLEIDYFTLVDYFSGQKPFDHGKIATWRRNLALTERYLLELWAPVNLRAEGHTILRSLRNEADENKNRYLLQILPDYYGRERVEFNRISGAFALTEAEYRDDFIQTCQNHGLSIYGIPKDDTDESGASGEEKLETERSESDIFDSECENASYADVCEALNVLSALPGNNRQYKLIYALHMFYTIRLHQLLLDQIELSEPIVELRLKELGRSAGDDVPPEVNIQVDNHLVRFLADVLYKRKDLCRKPQGFALWQYDLNILDLQKVCGADTSLNYDFFSLVATFCRNIKPANHSYVSLPISEEEFKWLTEGHDLLRFNFFYSNLRDFDMLTSFNQKDWKEYFQDPILRKKMVGSFMLLINWDIQYTLLRNMRYYKLDAEDILENMDGVYRGENTISLLKQISQLTDNSKYEHIFEIYQRYRTSIIDYKGDEDSKNSKILLYQLILSIPKLEKYVHPYFNLGLKEIIALSKKQNLIPSIKRIIHSSLNDKRITSVRNILNKRNMQDMILLFLKLTESLGKSFIPHGKNFLDLTPNQALDVLNAIEDYITEEFTDKKAKEVGLKKQSEPTQGFSEETEVNPGGQEPLENLEEQGKPLADDLSDN